jgi:hypothetical protein
LQVSVSKLPQKEKSQVLQVQTTNLVDSKSERVSKMPKKIPNPPHPIS